jgi:hypothetical protein
MRLQAAVYQQAIYCRCISHDRATIAPFNMNDAVYVICIF